MKVIGLTGGIGSGKSTVAELFQKKGITIIDADLITRELTKPGQPALKAIIAHFGPALLKPDQTLDRTQLRKLIFNHPQEKTWLENLLHPLVRAEMKKQAAAATSAYCIAVIPLLFETEKNPLIDRVLVVDAPEDIQITRATQRDQHSQDEIKSVIKEQIERKKRLELADDIIDNSGSLDDLIQQVDKLHEIYLRF